MNSKIVQSEPEHGMGTIFKNIVESSTDGAIKVELYPNARLGDNKSSYEMIRSGLLEAAIGTGVLPIFSRNSKLSAFPNFSSPPR